MFIIVRKDVFPSFYLQITYIQFEKDVMYVAKPSILFTMVKISSCSVSMTLVSAEFLRFMRFIFLPLHLQMFGDRMNCRARIWRFITEYFLQPYRSARERHRTDPSEKDKFLIQLFRKESFCMYENVIKLPKGEISFLRHRSQFCARFYR